jgi:MFS family permease
MSSERSTAPATDPALPAGAGTPPQAEQITFLHILRNSGFRNLWLGQVVSQMGDYFAFLATMVVVSGFSTNQEQITLAVSGMMIAFTLPRLLFGMLAGVFVDRWDRRRTMLVSDGVRAVLTLLLIPAFLAQSLIAMYVLGFVMSAIGTLFIPAKGALLPRLVPKEQLLSANSLSQTSQMLATLIGPALAGATFALVGNGNQWIAFVVDSLSFVISAFAIWRIRVPSAPVDEAPAPPVATTGAVRQVWDELLVGLRALVLNKVIATLAVIAGITMLGIGAVNVLWLVFLKERFGFEANELAWRVSIMDIVFSGGMIVASVVIGNFLARVAPKWLIVVSLLSVAVGVILFPMLPDYWTMVACMALIGLGVAPLNTGTNTLLQLLVPNHQLGRVGAGLSTVSDGTALISMSLAGVLGATLGIPTVFLLGGLLCIGGGILAWITLPVLHGTAAPEAAATETATETEAESPGLPSRAA